MAANPMPAAEVDVTADLVRRLLAEQQPDLAHLPVTPLANGWDNTLFRLGDDLVARLPRRAVAAGIVLNEQRWLPVIAPRLPLPVPVPLRTGVPGAGYPWAWSVVAYLPGTPAADDPPFDRAEAARAVGGFLGALHVPAPRDAPANPYRGGPLAERAENFSKNLDMIAVQAGKVGHVDRTAIEAVWSDALAAPPHGGPPVWLHGDPHPANILISDGRVSGVLDFGDITAGDPAADLALAWMLLPAGQHAAFRAAYGDASPAAGGTALEVAVADARWRRARGWALGLGVMFLAWSADNPQLREVGRRTVDAVVGSSTHSA